MDITKQNSDPFAFDGFDCPQKLESLDQAKVDDSWFLRKSIPDNSKAPQLEHDKIVDPLERLSTISEKENYSSNLIDNETYNRPTTSSNPSESTTQPVLSSKLPVTSVATSSLASEVAAAAPPRLVTANRCQQRSKWETLRLQRERRHDLLRQQRKDSICRHEQERVQQLRAAAVPKAQPIRHYKPMRIHRSDKPLTVAKSPDFALSRKDRHKPIQDQAE